MGDLLSGKPQQEFGDEARRESFDAAEGPLAHGEDPYYHIFSKRKVEGALLATTGGEILDASEAACRILGRTKEELIGRDVQTLFDPSDPQLRAAWENQRRTGYFRGELRLMRRADGGEEPFEVPAALVGSRDRSGMDRIVIVLKDSAEMRKAGAPAWGSEEWFFSLARYAADIVMVLNPDGSIRYASPSIERISGYTPEEVIGTPGTEAIHPDDLVRVLAEFAEIWSRPGISAPVEHRARHKDGHWLHLETTANNLLEDPELQAVVLTVRDVTERVRAQEKERRIKEDLERRVQQHTAQLMSALGEAEDSESMLHESLDMFRATFEQAAVGLAHLDLEGRWLRVNQKLLEILGYNRQELLRKTFQDVTHPDDRGSDLDRMQRMLCGEMEGYSVDKRYVKKDGSQVWVSLSVSLVRHPTGEPAYFIAVVEDVDERKRAELILNSLTPREIEVLKRLARGLTNRQIARELYISADTAKFHVRHVVEKLGVSDRTQAAYRAAELGLFTRVDSSREGAKFPRSNGFL